MSDPRPVNGQFSAYKPTYVLWGPSAPNVKFQFSAKFRAFSPDGPAAQKFPPISNLYFGYTQMSLWDTEDLSDASIDTTYMPELFYATHTAPHAHHRVGGETLGFQAGIRHESNGESDSDSRNVNYAYVQPTLYFGDPDGISGQIGPLVRVYFSESEDNPDIENYLGYFGLDGTLRFGHGWQIAALGRIGAHPGKGAIQVDVSYPLKQFIGGKVDTFFHVQYFNGFGESIHTYDEHDQKLRFGVSFIR